ncbi:MAG: hypothetical protein ABFD75_12135 [Smithella sp.]
MTDKKSYEVSGKCTACCLEEVKSCSGYDRSAFEFLEGCLRMNRAGKCMRPDNRKEAQNVQLAR